MTSTVVVGSGNPVKVDAVRDAFASVFPAVEHRLESLAVPSGVSDQPRGRAETREGALHRADAAAERRPDAAFWVGIEGGVFEESGEMYAFARVAVRSSAGRTGESSSGAFRLPDPVAERVRRGTELGAADDEVFGTDDSKRGRGAVGLLTGGAVTRTGLYAQAVCLALAPFVHDDLYGAGDAGPVAAAGEEGA